MDKNKQISKKIVNKGPTPEQIEYEDLTKRMRLVTAKLRISQEGIDVSSLSQHKLDMIMRIFDDMDHVQRDTQQKTSIIQQNANIEVQKVNQEASKKFVDIQKKYQDIIKSLREVHSLEQIQTEEIVPQNVVQVEPVKEEVGEKTHEEKVSEITDIVLKAMRDSVSSKVDEILKTVGSKTETIVGQDMREDILAKSEIYED